MPNPQVRQDDIVVRTLFDEMVIYDLKQAKIHALNATAAFVWRHCDGSRSRQELARLLHQEFQIPQAGAMVALTLDRLKKAELLVGATAPDPEQRPISRREALKLTGVTVALLPVVKSIVAPTVAQAASGNRVNEVCFVDSDCGSGLCCVGNVCRSCIN